MNESAHCVCGRPVRGTAICDGCEARLTAALRDIPPLTVELETVLTRQAKGGGGYVGYVQGGKTRALPFDTKASEVAGHLKAVLVGWVRNCVDTRAQNRPEGPVCGRCMHLSCNTIQTFDWPVDRTPSLSAYLLRHIGWLRMYGPASEAVDEITEAVAAVRRVAFRERVQTSYAGICSVRVMTQLGPTAECDGELYAKVGAVEVTCEKCAAVHDMAERRKALLAAVETQLCTPPEIVAAVSSLSRPISRQQLDRWMSKGRLFAHGTREEPGQENVAVEDRRTNPLLRVGEVLDLLAAERTCRCGAPLPALGSGRPTDVCSRACAKERNKERMRRGRAA